MARFLIASWDGGGNTPPAYHLGARLRRRGHQVGMTGWPSMAARAGAAGLEFLGCPQSPAWPCGVAFEDDWDRLERYLFGAACRADIVAAAKRFGPDVLIIDCMLRAGFDAVRDVRLPAAGLVHVSYQGFVHEWGNQAMSTAVAAMLEPCTAVIAAHPARLDSPRPMPPGHAYVGPIADPAPGTLDPHLASTLATPGDPWLLVSLSTTTQSGQRAALTRILGAVARLPVRALVTLGGAVTASDLDLPPNAVATRYIPHELALPHMSAVVSHAGMSTISTALAAGVPLICAPLGRDQPGNAGRVAAAGAGLAVGQAASTSELADAVTAVLSDPAHARTARAIAAELRPLGSGEYATGLVEALASL